VLITVVYAMTQSMDSDEPAILPDDAGGGRLAARVTDLNPGQRPVSAQAERHDRAPGAGGHGVLCLQHLQL